MCDEEEKKKGQGMQSRREEFLTRGVGTWYFRHVMSHPIRNSALSAFRGQRKPPSIKASIARPATVLYLPSYRPYCILPGASWINAIMLSRCGRQASRLLRASSIAPLTSSIRPGFAPITSSRLPTLRYASSTRESQQHVRSPWHSMLSAQC